MLASSWWAEWSIRPYCQQVLLTDKPFIVFKLPFGVTKWDLHLTFLLLSSALCQVVGFWVIVDLNPEYRILCNFLKCDFSMLLNHKSNLWGKRTWTLHILKETVVNRHKDFNHRTNVDLFDPILEFTIKKPPPVYWECSWCAWALVVETIRIPEPGRTKDKFLTRLEVVNPLIRQETVSDHFSGCPKYGCPHASLIGLGDKT